MLALGLMKFRLRVLKKSKLKRWRRHVSIGDLLFERSEIAELNRFGSGTTCYENVLVIGDVEVGKNCWIGPNVVLDGSGGLRIGDNVVISAGAQIYTHLSLIPGIKTSDINTEATIIGNYVYIGPNSIISKGVVIGNHSLIGALSFVDKNIPSNSKFIANKLTTKK